MFWIRCRWNEMKGKVLHQEMIGPFPTITKARRSFHLHAGECQPEVAARHAIVDDLSVVERLPDIYVPEMESEKIRHVPWRER